MGLHAFKLLDEAYSEYDRDEILGRQLPLGTYFSILDRSGEQPVQTSYSTVSFNEVMREQHGKTDRYFSQCFFNERDRKGVHCESISHLWVDLDFYKSPASNPFRSLHIREKDDDMGAWESERLRRFCDDNRIIMPSYIIDSGNGAYALWQFSENQKASDKTKLMFREMMVRLITLFSEWNADPSVKDTSRVLRVPGSINSKTGKPCRIVWPVQGEWMPEQYFEPAVKHGRTYDFHHLYESLIGQKEPEQLSDLLRFSKLMNLEPDIVQDIQKTEHASALKERREKYQKNKAAGKTRKPRVKQDTSVTYLSRAIGHRTDADTSEARNRKGYRSWESWCRKVLHDLKTLIQIRCHGREAKPGFRDVPLFLAGCMIAQIHRPDFIMKEVGKWMDGHFDEWMTDNCHTLLSTLIANAKTDFAKGAKKRGYSYTTDDMIQLLALTGEEMKHMTVLIDHEERLLRKREKRHTQGNSERPQSKGQTREEWLSENNLSKLKPWEAMGIKRSRYYELKKSGKI